MKIVVTGRGGVGVGMDRLRSSRGHRVTALGRDGGEASDVEVGVIAVTTAQTSDALHRALTDQIGTACYRSAPLGQC